MSVIFRVLLTILLGNTLCLKGLEFLLNNITIPTDGSGRVLITDIDFTGQGALICQSSSLGGLTQWYLDPEDENPTSIAEADKIHGNNFQGWTSKRNENPTRDELQIVRLKRVSDTAVEGRFTCKLPKDKNSPRGLLILHPINSVVASIEMIPSGNNTFRVRCTSTGGRVLNMSVTGPDFNSELSNIQAVGNQTWMGDDSYTATTGNISGGSERQLYYCTASNGVSSLTGCVVLKANISAPKGVRAEIVMNPLSVRVSWQAVEDADRYNVTFTKAKGRFQEGPCKDSSHTATLSVDVPNTNISLGQDVEESVTTMLRAYTTYLITVVAESDVLGTSDGCNHIILTTPQTSAVEAPQRVVLNSAESYSLILSVRGVTKCRYLNGLIDMYRVHYSTNPNGTVQTQNETIEHIDQIVINVIKIILTGLTPYTTYSIEVAVVNVQGDVGPYSTPAVAETAESTPGPVVITAFPSFFEITINWNKTDIPNGRITHYEVYYGRRHFKPSAITTTTGLDTSFTTPGHLEPGTEMFFTVRAYTRVGGGEPRTVNVSTLKRPSAVEGVTVTSLNDTSVTVSWNAVIIPDFPIDNYTVVYSPVSESDRKKDGEMTAVFPGSVTSGVITDLEPAVIYQFQVFANITANGVTVEGERSDPVTTEELESKEGNGHKMKLAALIVSPVSVAAVIVFLFSACIWMRSRRDRKKINSSRHTHTENSFVPLTSVDQPLNRTANGVINTTPSPIPVDQFGDFVAHGHDNDDAVFKDHFYILDNDAEFSTVIGTTPQLMLLNRRTDITVYDNNRIILRPIGSHLNCQRDFINASYIDGYTIKDKYIATQSPLPETTVDFWRLVWQEKPPTIVVLTNLMEGGTIQCQQYWPEIGADVCGPFQITITDQQIQTNYTTRSFLVQLIGSRDCGLNVTQFHFTAWPDHGVPEYATPILAFHKIVKKHHRPSEGPLLVHCSAGVGRTGTLITIDRVLDQIREEKVVDIAGAIIELRKQRMKMVQTLEQYIFIHDAVLEAVTYGDTQITARDLREAIQQLDQQDPLTHTSGFENQFKVLDQVSPIAKEVPREEGYIDASIVNGYRQQRTYVIAQSPMQSTLREFWKIVYDRRCGIIVMLNKPIESGEEVCHQYWPTTDSMEADEFTITLLEEEKLPGFTLRLLSVVHRKYSTSHQVSQIHITTWKPDGFCSNFSSIIASIAEMSKIQRNTGNHPILIHCSDTVSRSGMFCAIATTIERCKTEGVVDVFQVVKALRMQKPGAVRNIMQYKIIFDIVLVFLDSFDIYSNFS